MIYAHVFAIPFVLLTFSQRKRMFWAKSSESYQKTLPKIEYIIFYGFFFFMIMKIPLVHYQYKIFVSVMK